MSQNKIHDTNADKYTSVHNSLQISLCFQMYDIRICNILYRQNKCIYKYTQFPGTIH